MKLTNVALHPPGAAAAPVPELLCIFGTGDLGRSLGLRLLQSGYRVVYGSRRPHSCGPLPQGAQVRRMTARQRDSETALRLCQIIVRGMDTSLLFVRFYVSTVCFVQVMSHVEAAKVASLIFVCVHREHYNFLQTLATHLEGKVNESG